MDTLPDFEARQHALDISRSFIVQAPAGSGKTSLLTQRYLALLATVKEPEHIVAITFTRKAAAEMQARIFEALALAEGECPQEPYLQQTYRLAQNALAQNDRQGWSLLKNKHRLSILTIDAFCLYLTKRMPLRSKAIPFSQIADNADELYRQAARHCIETMQTNAAYQAPYTTLQSHLGNNQQQLLELLVLMLQKREQWLPVILKARHLDKSYFETVLDDIKQHIATDIADTLPSALQPQIECIVHYQSAFSGSPILTGVDPIDWQSFDFWQKCASLLLTTNGQLRKRFTQKEGFPALSHFKTAAEKERAKHIKTTLSNTVEQLQATPQFVPLLQRMHLLPDSAYSDSQWQILQTLITLLPLLVAELKLLFFKTHQVDFTEISLQALEALGEDEPTDLALYLDYHIQHLLIDEFQDTSIKQFRLIEKIIEQWGNDEHKTLFLVGDPMQSIYRFREAEVGLFLQVKHQGLGELYLEPLTLSCNFRSNVPLIEWVNYACSNVFPMIEDMETGAVTYTPSICFKESISPPILCLSCETKAQETATIIDYICTHPDEEIAILVRSRNQLKHIVPALTKQGINIEGVDLERLIETPLINLLFQITRLIYFPLDKLALSTLLLSPLCGIDYATIESLYNACDQHDCLTLLNALPSLSFSHTTTKRIKKVLLTINHCHTKSYRESLLELTHYSWQTLNGEHLVSPSQHNDFQLYWQLLEKYQWWDSDLSAFERELSGLFSNASQTSNVKVMTIHKAKGLEFDTVILPSLDYSGKAANTPLLSWLHYPTKNQLLLSPIHATFDEKDKLSHYIEAVNKEKEHYEKQRLLYVAITRAKHKLVMINASGKDASDASANSFLSHLYPFLNFTVFSPDNTTLKEDDETFTFYRLGDNLFEDIPQPTPLSAQLAPYKTMEYDLQQIIGTFIHEQLYYFAQTNNLNCLPTWKAHHEYHLRQQGLTHHDIAMTKQTFETVFSNLQICEIGQWIFEPRANANNEYSLASTEGHFIIDRTFIEQDICWIIDYKVTTCTESHFEKYQNQLNQYAKLMAALTAHPIRLMLYYPLLKKAKQWCYEPDNTTE